jgi:hypothetical protein
VGAAPSPQPGRVLPSGAGDVATVRPAATSSARRATLRAALAEVLGSAGRLAGFVVVAAGVALLYTILLPFDYTQRFELANWHHLDAGLLAWAVVLGTGMGLVLSVQVHAVRRVARARAGAGTAGGVAFMASLAPSFLCCTPIIPTLLAFVGVSGVGLYGTTGALQHFFAVHQGDFLAASAVLLALTSWWGLRKVATAECLSGDGCDIDPCCTPGAAAADAAALEDGALR